MNKQTARQEYLTKRKLLSQAEYEALNLQLLNRFQELDFEGVKCVHLFLPIHERKEPDTFLFREWLKQAHPKIKRVFPKANFADHTMENYLDDAALILAPNAFGVPEPVSGNAVSVQEIDLMLVPLLAFDSRGYRAGYGKGFYDRFMAQCKPGTKFIGLSFFEPVDILEDTDQYDIKLHSCITPQKVYTFPA